MGLHWSGGWGCTGVGGGADLSEFCSRTRILSHSVIVVTMAEVEKR